MLFPKISKLDEFEGTDFKYENSRKKNPNKAFLVPDLSIFDLFAKFCNYTNLTMLISNMTIVYSNSSQKYENKVLLVPNLRIFIIVPNFPNT